MYRSAVGGPGARGPDHGTQRAAAIFQLPRQAAALAAYNAEAEALNAQRVAAKAGLEACLDAMEALAAASETSLDINAVPERDRLAVENAKKLVPSTFTPPPSPPVGKNWTAKGTPLQPLYDVLRMGNPGNVGNATLRGSPRPQVGDRDPAYPASSGRTFGRNAAGESAASPDHIIPLAEIVNMRGFTELKPEYMYVVTRAPINYQWLSRGANSSKQSRSVAGMSGVDPAWQEEQIALEQQVRTQLQDIINKLLTIQG